MDGALQKKKGTFQHSSFLAGGATSAAGQLVLEKGVLKVKDEFLGKLIMSNCFTCFIMILSGCVAS